MESIEKCEEALGKNTSTEIESGISCASKAIERFKTDAKLHLLRAKLSFKLLVILKFHGKVDGRIKNCLADCEQAIAFIERGFMMGDSTTAKIEAMQLGYLCCEKLNSQQKKMEFNHRLKELRIEMPANTDQVRNKLLRLFPSGRHGSSGLRYSLKGTSFTSVDEIPVHLLESISTCYSQKIPSCRWCFLTHLPSTQQQLLSMSASGGVCKKCLRQRTGDEIITVIPASNLCESSAYGKFVGIPPTPKHTNKISVFKYCNKHERTADHTRCLRLTRKGDAWYPHSVEEMVIWTVEYKQGVSFEQVYKEYCRAEPPPANTKNLSDDRLYCGYCDVHTNDPLELEQHCKQDHHKYAVFADSGRDVLWQFEPPPPEETVLDSIDKAKEWKLRLKRRTRKVEEIPFGLRDQDQAKLEVTTTIFGVETRLECSCMTLSASRVLSARSSETINWTLSIKGNQHHSFRGVRFSEESVFKLTRVFPCSTKKNFPITNNMCCAPDSRPGLLLGIVKVCFSALPNNCDDYNTDILIDVGLQKILSIPVELKVVSPQLYKLNKCLQSGKLYLNTKSIFSDTTMEIKEMSPSPISLEDKQLVKCFQQQLISSQLYSNDCATLLESDDQTNYYKQLSTLVCLEGDHRQRLVQRISNEGIMAKLTFVRGPPSMEVNMEELGEAEVAECSTLMKFAPSVLVHFCNQPNTTAESIWECRKELTEDVLLIFVPPSFSIPMRYDGTYFCIDFEFTTDLTHLAKCYSATISFERRKLGYLLFPSNPLYHYQKGNCIICGSSLKKLDMESKELNLQQEQAMKAILLSPSVLPVVVAGPFGTGKTFLLSCAVEYLIKNCPRSFVLVCTLTNSAANVYLEYFHNRIPHNSASILRLVYAKRKLASIPEHLRQKYCLLDSAKEHFCYPDAPKIIQYRVIVATLGLAQELQKYKLFGHFTHILIDEAAQVTVPEVMMALSLASNTTKVVLAGDHMQTSPQVYSPLAKEYHLHKSPLEQVYAEYSHTPDNGNQILLTSNYRTHGDILKLPSKLFYRGKLRSCDSIEKHPTISPLVFLTSNDDQQETYLQEYESYLNTNEAESVVKFVKETLLPTWPTDLWGEDQNIAILTTEYAQVRYIRSLLKRERLPMIFVDTITNAQGREFRVVILSVVRTHNSIDKDSIHKCSFYTDERALNTAFTRVQSLIVTAAHPLSIITKGSMSCKLFWAAYLSQSMKDEDCDQLKKLFVMNRNVGQIAKHWQLSPDDYEVYSALTKQERHARDAVSNNQGYFDQILEDLERENEDVSITTLESTSYHGEEQITQGSRMQTNSINTATISAPSPSVKPNHTTVPPKSIALLTVGSVGYQGSNSVVSVNHNLTPHDGHKTTSRGNNTRKFAGKRKVSNRRAIVQGLHNPYVKVDAKSEKHMVTVIKGAESGFAVVLDPAEKDIWLPDSSALNRSLRGDTVIVESSDSFGKRKGEVVANISTNEYIHPKEYFVCFSDRWTRNLLVPIDTDYPKIDTCQTLEEDNGLSVFVGDNQNRAAIKINYEDVLKNVYLVRLGHPWKKDHVYPKGVPVKHFSLKGDLTANLLKIMKYNYVPAMTYFDGGFSPQAINEVQQQFREIPQKEMNRRKRYNNVFTIDDEETVVMDDALSLEFDKGRNFVVNAHIADASYFVKPRSGLDKDALQRGRTFYSKEEAMFMLPDDICINHGSLQAGKDRLAVTTQFVFSKTDYTLLSPLSDVEVHRSVVCSVCKLNKEQVGKFLLENTLEGVEHLSSSQFGKLKKDLSTLNKIAAGLRKSQWPDSHLYQPDRGTSNRYSLAGGSLVEMFMCLCNKAIPAKLLKLNKQVGPVVVHQPIKHFKQHEWLSSHQHLLKCCPLFNRMISPEALQSFNAEEDRPQPINDDGGSDDEYFPGSFEDTDSDVADEEQSVHESEEVATDPDGVLTISNDTWQKIVGSAGKRDSSELATVLCSLDNFPELYVAYRKLCRSQTKAFYTVITRDSQVSQYKHSHFGTVYSHFTSPLRRYPDILLHRAILSGKNASLPTTETLHRMSIHKWDERKFSEKRDQLYVVECCKMQAGSIAVTAYVGQVSNKLMELHMSPELHEFLSDRICEIRLSHLQTRCDENRVLKWKVEMIPAPCNRSSKKENKRKEEVELVQISISTLAKVVEALHNDKFTDAKDIIKTTSLTTNPSTCIDSAQEVDKKSSHKLTITKHIRENSTIDIQISSTHSKSYSVDPTVSLVHISKTFSCCLLHVKYPIECYAPEILNTPPFHPCNTLSDYVMSWQPIVEAESITNSTSSKRVPVIIKELRLEWTSRNEAQFDITSDFRIKFRKPFATGDLVCIQYRNLLSNSDKFDLEPDKDKKVTWVAHGKIIGDDIEQTVKLEFPRSTILPTDKEQTGKILPKVQNFSFMGKLCNLEVIPLQVTFRRIEIMFHKLQKYSLTPKQVLLEQICCRKYSSPIRIPANIEIEGDVLNRCQREAVEKAVIEDNKLLLIQGPPGTGKSTTCVELMKRFVEDNKAKSQGMAQKVLYCAPSNKAVNVGACEMLKKFPHIQIVRSFGHTIEKIELDKLCPGLTSVIPIYATRSVVFRNDEDVSMLPDILKGHCLHEKIRDPQSQQREIQEFIEYERWLDNHAVVLSQEENNYLEIEEVKNRYITLRKAAEQVVLKAAEVIFCTCAEAGSGRLTGGKIPINQCVIDECGMCTEPETILPMMLSEKFILVGDHKQLQPIVLNKIAESLGLKISMFQRLFEDKKMSRYCITLTTQYRMHRSICEFPSIQFYHEKLQAAEEVLARQWGKQLPSNLWLRPQQQRCVFIHVEGTEEISGIDAKGSYEESKYNKEEARVVKYVVEHLQRSNIPPNEIMVLTPYRAHKDHIKELLPNKVEVNTVHGSQGRECNVIILTTVRSLPENEIPAHPSHNWVNKHMGFVTDEHLINVAITRAREALCIIGNAHLIKKHPMWRDLLDHYEEEDSVLDFKCILKTCV